VTTPEAAGLPPRRLIDSSLLAGAILTAVALVPRLIALGSRPMWYDEAFSALLASKGADVVLRGLLAPSFAAMVDTHPPLYFLSLAGWMAVFGSGPIAARSLSVLIGIGVVLVGYGIGTLLFSRRQAFFGSLLTALLPFQVHYAQEARMYALESLLLLGAVACFVMGVRRRSPLPWAGFGVLAAAAQYTHHLAFVFLVPLALTAAFIRRSRVILGTLAGSCLALLLYLPWLVTAFGQLRLIERAYWIQAPGAVNLVRTILVYIGGLPVAQAVLPILLSCVLLVLTYGVLANADAARRRTPGWMEAAWLLYLSMAPPTLMAIVSLRVPIYLERALLPSGVTLALWLGWALAGPSRAQALRWTAAAGLIVAVALGLHGYYTYRGFPYAPFEDLLQVTEEEKGEGEVVLHADKLTALPAAYSGAPSPVRFLDDPPGSSTDTLSPGAQQLFGLKSYANVGEAVGGVEGVWFVLFRQEIEEYQAQGIAPHPMVEALGRIFRLAGEQAYGDVLLQHYTRPPD